MADAPGASVVPGAVTDPVSPASLLFVSCVSDWSVARERLLASPCLQPGARPLVLRGNACSAAEAVNAVLDGRPHERWLVWLHQDVYLPAGWDVLFAQRLQEATLRWPHLAVAGVYGVRGAGADAVRAGRVLDRGRLLHEPAALPCLVDSLDELLLAVRCDAGLRLDPALGFDFYATDLVLQAQAAGLAAAALDACCEHWSGTPAQGAVHDRLVQRITASAAVFEHKWRQRLPLTTPCFAIAAPGDTAAFLEWARRLPSAPQA
ncbi:hypothetical protein SAMN05428957_104103 [Oryzisolibacter propanilivorax]|uniref:Glycosyltransferase like family protein n=1 Tax=Oryzisolibacter propanilivorax TaxID=1527607 RepID=A0A1G9S4V9_9BURK|nr:hypothetical protein [Oryzisolibacter propanilivorax]SDM30431.1 hypothetical protein SAMN05428957_104103 [Oryzisolibacter propanilivorax]